MKQKVLIAVTALAVVLGLVLLANWRLIPLLVSRPYMGKVSETWETSNQTLRLRVDRHVEEDSFVIGGAYYVFRSAPAGTDNWRDIMTFRHDDPVPIPREQVRFLNEHVAVVFMGWMYAVTTDGGANWSLWNSQTDLPKWQCCNYGLIKDVELELDGRGKLILNPIPERSGEVPELHTKDYGRHWNT